MGLIFQDWNNEEILEKLRISRYTLLKHLQNIYRKWGFLPVGLAEAGALKKPGRKEGAALQTNDFLLYNEVVYRIHACRTMEEFPTILLTQVKLLIPLCLRQFHPHPHGPEDPGGHPRRALLLSPPPLSRRRRGGSRPSTGGTACGSAMPPEAVVARDSELLSGDSRFDAPSYRQIYLDYHIYDCLQMNVALAGRNMGRLALYRTRAEGAFTDQDTFAPPGPGQPHRPGLYPVPPKPGGQPVGEKRSLTELIATYSLTRREGEILGLILQDCNNEEILAKLVISRNTLLKHLQNLYRKCGVSSRWDLRKLQG